MNNLTHYIEEIGNTIKFQTGAVLTRLLFTPDGICPVCKRVLFYRKSYFCPDCQKHFHPVSGAACPGCGTPVSESGRYCPDCLREDDRLLGGIVFFRRDPLFDGLVRQLRSGKRPELMTDFGYQMGRKAGKAWPGTDFTVIPGRAGEERLAEGFEAGLHEEKIREKIKGKTKETEAKRNVKDEERRSPDEQALLIVSLERDVAGALSFLSDSGMKVYCASLFDA